jgi:hypothetical protein
MSLSAGKMSSDNTSLAAPTVGLVPNPPLSTPYATTPSSVVRSPGRERKRRSIKYVDLDDDDELIAHSRFIDWTSGSMAGGKLRLIRPFGTL